MSGLVNHCTVYDEENDFNNQAMYFLNEAHTFNFPKLSKCIFSEQEEKSNDPTT